MTMTGKTTDLLVIERIRDEIARRQRFVISSHVRPDGDSIGSQLALAAALDSLGKSARIVNSDAAPAQFGSLPRADRIEIAKAVEGTFDAAIVLECGATERTGVAGLDRYFIINIDHHPGNTLFGALNWHDEGAAACGEMVYDLIAALGAPLSIEIATSLYVAVLTDTGSFHHSGISPKTFDICRRFLEAGVDPVAIARQVYDSSTVGRIRLWGAVLASMEVDASNRLAIIHLDRAAAAKAGTTFDDTEGLINVPLTVPEIQAVVFFKEPGDGECRVSFRSKGDVDVNEVAAHFGGGGHKNASGCTLREPLHRIRPIVIERVLRAIEDGAAKERRV
jgi:bifunctional oligoribonuclease and PAP phosphatase NrnA